MPAALKPILTVSSLVLLAFAVVSLFADESWLALLDSVHWTVSAGAAWVSPGKRRYTATPDNISTAVGFATAPACILSANAVGICKSCFTGIRFRRHRMLFT